ncbi:unnamed protein product [Ranitomeya imitator]|uniref:Paraoxonase n=1 Tax=Ranitomeya imitator TaxID=111125 RepID=A0ABN9MDI4_9NEOB|nr:unnamed protein product [Ranitomeya imitator]
MSFFGTATYYRRFNPHYSTLSKSLTDLNKKKLPLTVDWTVPFETTFQALKTSLSSSPVLQAADFERPYVVQTDASDFGLGALLNQVNSTGQEHPILYLSMKLLPREMAYYMMEKECLAIVWALPHDSVYLFVVNHPHYKSTVEIFKFAEEENVLVHVKTIKHSALHNVNNIVPVGPESFYATNDYYFSDFIMRHVEMVFGLTLTNVVYYSPGEVREVAAGFYQANGIAMSADQKYIYVADLTGRTVNVFEKHANWSLSPVKVVELETLLDNLSVDPVTGDVWTGGHPNGMKLFYYDPKDLPGSEIVRIQNILSDNPIVTTVYANDGSVIQGSSCASVYGNKLFIGTIFHKALCCQL